MVLAATSVTAFTSFLDVTIIDVAFADLRSNSADTSPSVLSWAINGYNIVFAAALVPTPGPGALITARLIQALGTRTPDWAGALLLAAGIAALAVGTVQAPA